MTVNNEVNIVMALTVTAVPANTLMTRGIVKGASSDVVIVSTNARLCLPPTTSARSGDVIPLGIAARSISGIASDGEIWLAMIKVIAGKMSNMNSVESTTIFISFASFITSFRSSFRLVSKKIICRKRVV